MAKQLDRQLGFWAVYSIALGAMLGTGVFVLPAVGAAAAGPYLWISYLLAGLIVLPAVLTKAELATAMPVSGGAYVYVDRAMGPWMGTVTGLGTWFSLSAKTAFAFVGLGAYLVLFSSFSSLAFSVVALGLLVWLNLMGVGKVSGIQKIIVVICIATLVVFCYLGATSHSFEAPPNPDHNALRGILTGTALLFAAYAGVTKVCSIAEEVHHPGRNLPLGMIAAQLSVMVIYGCVGWVFAGHIDFPPAGASTEFLANDPTPISTAGRSFLDTGGFRFVAVVAVVGLISTCNAGVLSLSRFPFAMARDNLMPEGLTKVSPRHGTPSHSIWLSGLLLLGLIFLPLYTLAKLASGFKIFIFSMNHLALIVLRESGARWYRPSFKSPFYPWMQIFGILSGIFLLCFVGLIGVIGIAAGVLAGSIWYWIYGKPRVSRAGAFQHLWGEAKVLRETENAEQEEEMTDQAPRVIVPLFSDQNDNRSLVRLGASFVEFGLLEVLRLEEVPEQLHLMDQIDDNEQQNKTAKEAEEVCQELQIALDFNDVITHNAKQALLHHAQATKAQWIVMAWPKTNEHMRFVRDPMAWWLDHPPCDLAVLKDRGSQHYRRILVLAEPGPYDSLVTHVADRLAQQDEGELLLYRVVPTETSPDEFKALSEYHLQLGELLLSNHSSLIERSDDPISSIAKHSKNFDLIVMGAHAEKALKTLLFGSYEHKLAEAAHCSVLRLKTPRDMVHPRLAMSLQEQPGRLELGPAIQSAPLAVQVHCRSKEELFSLVAKNIATKLETQTSTIENAMWKRERFQSTALTGELALMAATCPSLKTTCFSAATLQSPVDFRGPGRRQVKTFFAILSPPGERQKQLWLLAQLARMTLRPDFLSAANTATNDEELREVLTKFGGNGLL